MYSISADLIFMKSLSTFLLKSKITYKVSSICYKEMDMIYYIEMNMEFLSDIIMARGKELTVKKKYVSAITLKILQKYVSAC